MLNGIWYIDYTESQGDFYGPRSKITFGPFPNQELVSSIKIILEANDPGCDLELRHEEVMLTIEQSLAKYGKCSPLNANFRQELSAFSKILHKAASKI